jgi:LPS O-antigen subunit length determinant protein (WzzB/FepE family)
MATWGEFINDVPVRRLNPGGMVVSVDDAITLWEDRRKLREEAAKLRGELAEAREACAREIEEFASACAAESNEVEAAVALLRACAQMIREHALENVPEAEVAAESAAVPEVPTAEPVHDDLPMAEPVVPMAEPVREDEGQ